jgi:hypothetical protein
VTEPPILIHNRKELTYLLCLAAELEHALMVEYLYAAFSLKQGMGETVERWRSVILKVATEEMLHWALVNNLLTAVGSAPFVSRPHLPHQAKGYPAGVQLALVPFGERALRHFLYLERPEGMDLEDAEGFDTDGPALPIMSESDLLPAAQEFSTVGHLYRSIEAGLVGLADRLGEDGLFIGPTRAQATADTWGWPSLVPITDLASARAAIEDIVQQGEGARGDWSAAHYGRFLAVFDEFRAMREADPDFEPAWPCVPAGVRPVEGQDPAVWITDPTTAAVTDLFDAVYDLLLQFIVRYFAFGSESDEELGVLARASVDLMYRVVKPLGLLLAELPVGPEHPGATAGANFQLAYRSNFLLPHKESAWFRFAERLDELATFSDAIEAPSDVASRLRPAADGLRAALVQLSPYLG